MSALADFEEAYARRSGTTAEALHQAGRFALPCDCEDSECEGWQMVHTRGDFELARVGWMARDRIEQLELGREADRRRITELETAARAVVDSLERFTQYGAEEGLRPDDFAYVEWLTVSALRSVLAAEHTQPEGK